MNDSQAIANGGPLARRDGFEQGQGERHTRCRACDAFPPRQEEEEEEEQEESAATGKGASVRRKPAGHKRQVIQRRDII